MKQYRKIGRGFRVSPTVVVLLTLMCVTDRSGISAMTLLAALLHECGHLLAARCMRIPLDGVRLELLGARIDVRGRVLSYGEEWLLCAAGPLFSLLGAAAAAPFWSITSLAQAFSCASLVLGVLNLLPIRTFDGGRMLEVALSAGLDDRTAQKVMAVCSFLFLFLLWAFAVYLLLRAGDGLSLFCFSLSLFLRYFENSL